MGKVQPAMGNAASGRDAYFLLDREQEKGRK
jgi:hypothetical protein